jgi:hypothetical protein
MVKLTIEITEVATTGRLIINIIPAERKASANESRGADLLQRAITDVGDFLTKLNHDEHHPDGNDAKQAAKIVEENIRKFNEAKK